MPEYSGYWKVGNTRPGILWTLDLGIDPSTSTARALAGTDVVTQIMRNRTTPGAAIVRTMTIEDAPTNKVSWKPATGDFTTSGDYEVEFDITDTSADVETVPRDEDNNYWYKVSGKVTD